MIKIKTNDGWKLVSGFNGTSDVIGSVIAFAGSTAPDGYFICDGRAVSRTIYSKLFAVIGTTYGPGDGSTTFNIPDLRDKFIEGSGTDSVGTAKAAGLPEISGTWMTRNFRNNYRTIESVSGAVTYAATATSPTTWGYQYQDGLTTNINDSTMYFNASNSNPIYGNSTTVQPPAMTMIYIIKWRDNVSGTAATPDGTSIITDENQVMSVNPQKFLATTGGTMTGQLKVASGGQSIDLPVDNGQLNVNGATDWTTGAHLALFGGNSSTNTGQFFLAANDGTNIKRLNGTPSGSLTWDGARVLTSTKPDVPWMNLTFSHLTAGEIRFCCKNNICYVEGTVLEWPAISSIDVRALATGIPSGYEPPFEVIGSLYTNWGQTPYRMAWVAANTVYAWILENQGYASGGRLFVSWPVF